jgi:L-threonylcarbamoyladenylate synthase
MILPGTDPQAILEAPRCIRAGGLVGFPTETVYGLGADASSDDAVAGIFAAKGRPADHPLSVHVADASQVNDYASSVPPFAARLMKAFWPGPLTVILPRRPAAGHGRPGVRGSAVLRCPGHRSLPWPRRAGAAG